MMKQAPHLDSTAVCGLLLICCGLIYWYILKCALSPVSQQVYLTCYHPATTFFYSSPVDDYAKLWKRPNKRKTHPPRCFAARPKNKGVSQLLSTSRSTSPLYYLGKFQSSKVGLNRRSTDPLVHHGRHFGRSIHALCNVPALISNGIIRMASDDPDEDLTTQ